MSSTFTNCQETSLCYFSSFMYLLKVNHTSPKETQVFILQFCPALICRSKLFKYSEYCHLHSTVYSELLLLTFVTWHILYSNTANEHPVLQNTFLICSNHLSLWLSSYCSSDSRRTRWADSLLLCKVACKLPHSRAWL